MKTTFLLSAIIFLNCTSRQTKESKHIIDFGAFSIETPSNWTKIKSRGTDSYVGGIAMNDKDTIEFDLGQYSWDLTEYTEVKLGDGKTYYINELDTAQSPTLYDSANKYKVVKSNIDWGTIDGHRAKILHSITAGNGITAVFIDSLYPGTRANTRFNIYGINLNP